MSLTVANPGAGDSLEPSITPHELSVGLVGTAGGGSLTLTQGTPQPVDVFNPEVFFAGHFSGVPWITFFKKTFPSATVAAREFWRDYSSTFYPLLSGSTAMAPSLTLSSLLTGKPVLILDWDGGETTQFWRWELRLRNTLTR
jgi:hypothetical protein